MKTIFTTLLGFLCFSALAQIDNCCINPDWIEPEAMCIAVYDPVIGCDGITYGNACIASSSGVTSYTNQSEIISTIDWDCNQSNALCTSWDGIEIIEPGMWVNPNNPCDMGECSPTGEFFGIAIDCAEWMGIPCNGEWVLEDGDCCATCIESLALCTSLTGVEIFEAGFWTNPNDPCDMGECTANGGFYGVAIDCLEGVIPCDGEWITAEGDCCSTCIETPPLNCEDISITLTNGWNMIGFGCAENTDAIIAFNSIVNKIVIVKDGIGNAYLPDWEFNGIGDLERGYGYLIKVSEEITNYNICE